MLREWDLDRYMANEGEDFVISGATKMGEACDTCHSSGKTCSVERVHAR